MFVNVAVIIPTLNASQRIPHMMAAIQAQTLRPSEVLIIDSNSTDDTAAVAIRLGARVVPLGSAKFNHGGTRQWALEQTQADIVIFLTDDAFPADNMAFANLCRALDSVADSGMAYGRQLPSPNATLFASHHRGFNYPATTRVMRRADIAQAGMKTFFASDSFAVYRRKTLLAIGGFPGDTIFGEDAHVAARMILAGHAVVYAADARVSHSHNYTLTEEFRRYFDAGVFHARNPWLQREFGGPSSEGIRFVKSEIEYLWRHGAAQLIPYAFLATVLKYLGYRIGKLEARVPAALKRRLSMYRGYWA
jgi:rhamnosyltransferase